MPVIHSARVLFVIGAVSMGAGLRGLCASPAPQLSLGISSAGPGTTILLPLSLSASGSAIAALQFDLEYDGSAISIFPTAGDVTRNSWKVLRSRNLDGNTGKTRFLIFGLNRDPLPDGVLINVFVTTRGNAAAKTHALRLTGLSCSDPDGNPLPLTGADGAITVQNAPGDATVLRPDAVLNAASLLSGPIAPGEIVTLIGSGIGPTTLPLCPCSIWPSSSAPAIVSDPDAKAVEVGVRFRADLDGYVTGLRFHKGPSNTGTHVGHLWTEAGTLLATVTFTSETPSGWQQADFDRPVQIRANDVYIASYYAPAGHYSADSGYFTSGVQSGVLHALADGPGQPNGVYSYGPGAFPNQSYRSTNYWVDLIFSATAPGSPSGGAAGSDFTGVLFNKVPGLVLYAAETQINAVVPYGLDSSDVSVEVWSGGQRRAEASVPSDAAAPGLFTTDASGAGQGAILNEDLTVNSPSNPAPTGTVVALFGTGSLGDTGQILPPVSVQVGGVDAEVLYAGLAPGLVPGAFQIHCRVPNGVTAGPAVSISLKTGRFSSQPGVTVSIR
jgi:uncharacterized protein (TIGR03437 family)